MKKMCSTYAKDLHTTTVFSDRVNKIVRETFVECHITYPTSVPAHLPRKKPSLQLFPIQYTTANPPATLSQTLPQRHALPRKQHVQQRRHHDGKMHVTWMSGWREVELKLSVCWLGGVWFGLKRKHVRGFGTKMYHKSMMMSATGGG